jgi:small conductance mechanosensitive channel
MPFVDGVDPESLLASLSGAIGPLAVILVVTLLALRFLRPFVRRALAKVLERQVSEGTERALTGPEIQKRVDTIESLVVSAGRLIVVVIAILLVLVFFNLGPLIAVLSLALAAFAFAGQDIVRDYLTGFLILAENQYYKGDIVRIAGVSGTVEELTLRRTILRDLSGDVHVVANGEVRVSSNLTRRFSRVNLDVEVAYGTDLESAERVIAEVGRDLLADPAWRATILEPPTMLRVDALGDSGITIKVVGSVRAGEQWAVTGQLRTRLLRAFGEAGIEIPFPHRVVISRGEGSPADLPPGTIAAATIDPANGDAPGPDAAADVEGAG